MDIAEAEAVVVKGRFCGSPKTASGGYIAGPSRCRPSRPEIGRAHV